MSEWIKWNGGNRPVWRRVLVLVRYRDGFEEPKPIQAGKLNWTHCNDGEDIIAYRIIKEGEE